VALPELPASLLIELISGRDSTGPPFAVRINAYLVGLKGINSFQPDLLPGYFNRVAINDNRNTNNINSMRGSSGYREEYEGNVSEISHGACFPHGNGGARAYGKSASAAVTACSFASAH